MRELLFLRTAGVASLMFLFGATVDAASVEERLDQLNRMSDKDRAEASEKAARKEGELV